MGLPTIPEDSLEEVESFPLSAEEAPIDQAPIANKVPHKKAVEQSFLVAQDADLDKLEPTYDTVYEGLVTEGFSATQDAAIARLELDDDEENKNTISALISDPNIDKVTKTKALHSYVSGGFVKRSLKDKYIANAATLDNSGSLPDMEAQDAVADTVLENTKPENLWQTLSAGDKIGHVAKKILAEPAAVANMLLHEAPAFVVDVVEGFSYYARSKKGAGESEALNLTPEQIEENKQRRIAFKADFIEAANKDGYPMTDATFTQALEYIMEKNRGSFSKEDKTYSRKFAEGGEMSFDELLGISKEDMNETYFMAGMEHFTNFTHYIANIVNPNDPRLVSLPLELLLFAKAPKAVKGTYRLGKTVVTKALTKKPSVMNAELTHPTGSILDITIKANPKLAGDMAVAAIFDPKPKFTESLGSTKEAIITEHVLPKEPLQPGESFSGKGHIIPDINPKIKQKTKELTKSEQVQQDLLFDDNLVKREERIADRDRRIAMSNETSLYYNQANSRLNMTGDMLDGTMVFTKGPNYAFTNKAQIKEHGAKLEKVAEEMKAAEIQAGVDAGLGTVAEVTKQFKKNDVMVRNLETGIAMTLKDFNKATKDRKGKVKNINLKGKYQLEIDFKKKYDTLANDMLGQTFKDTEISLFGSSRLGKALNNSALGEWFIGTGFTAKWFEKARADLNTRAGYAQTRIMENFREKVGQNKRLKKEIGVMVELQSSMKTDILSAQVLAEKFGHLSRQDRVALNEAQHAWRDSQNMLYEILNNGQKQKYNADGFETGLYIDGQWKGAAKEISLKKSLELGKKKDLKVYDPVTDSYVAHKPGDRLAIMHGEMKGNVRKNNETSDYIKIGKNRIERFPDRVVEKLPGHSFKEYSSNFFIDVVPTSLTHNGKLLTLKEHARELQAHHMETRGTATTRYEANLLIKEMMDPKSPHFIGEGFKVIETPRTAKLDTITDKMHEYKTLEDAYQNSHTRVEDMRTLEGDTVVMDPMKALDESTSRITRTAAAGLFDKTYKKAFMRDFAEVVDTARGEFPTDISQITATGKVGDPVRLGKLAKEAKRLYSRQEAFKKGSVMEVPDMFVQKAAHWLADVAEMGFLYKATKDIPLVHATGKMASKGLRHAGNLGLSGISKSSMRVGSLAFVTFALPVKHLIQQPMMFIEQSLIHPKSFGRTFKKIGSATSLILGGKLTEGAKGTQKLMGKELYGELIAEVKVMKQEGILEGIDHNTAAIETAKGHIGNLNDGRGLYNIGNKIRDKFGGVANIFNKYGFARGELLNRVGLWMQTKARWVEQPQNKGKDWRDPINAKEISFEAWKQSGAMNTAGSIKSQRIPLVNFVTQFQAIIIKQGMNVFQNTATNLSAGQRTSLAATRLVIHGTPYGLYGGVGWVIMDYMNEHEDKKIRDTAKIMQRGLLDRGVTALANGITGQDKEYTISDMASLGGANPVIELAKKASAAWRFANGERDADFGGGPSGKAIGNIVERTFNVAEMFKFDSELISKLPTMGMELLQMTSFGTKAEKAVTILRYNDLQTKSGRSLGVTDPDNPAGFLEAALRWADIKTVAEANYYRTEDKKRSLDERRAGEILRISNSMSLAVKHLDAEKITSDMTGNSDRFDRFLKDYQVHISTLEASGDYSSHDVTAIMNGVWDAQMKVYKSGAKNSMVSWMLSHDPHSAEVKGIAEYWKNHPDKAIRDVYDAIYKPINLEE
jgi:hypothetical protein